MVSTSFSQDKEVAKLVDKFIDTIETRSFMRQHVDFDKLREDARSATKDVMHTDSLLQPFRTIVYSLKDSHSSVALSEDKEDELSLIKMLATITYEEAGMAPPHFHHKMINNKYAYINVPGVVLEHYKYLDTLQKQIQELDDHNPLAWIIDLTQNDGGSFLPMVIPFHSLIDTTYTFSYATGGLNKDGSEELVDKFRIPKDGLYIDKSTEARYFKLDSIQAPPIKNNSVPIVVLISAVTASSGEITALHFLGQNNVTVVGTKSNGLTSTNELFYIDKGYSINLMTGVLHDRKGKTYKIGERITPDVLVDLNFSDDMDYKVRKKLILDNNDAFLDKALEVLSRWFGPVLSLSRCTSSFNSEMALETGLMKRPLLGARNLVKILEALFILALSCVMNLDRHLGYNDLEVEGICWGTLP